MPLPYRLWLVAGGISPWLPWFIALPSPAQIIPDVTLGTEASLVSPGVNVQGDIADLIEGGAVRGSNLFHSFLEFNINEGQRVYFGQPNGIINIFGRVTGGNGSNVMSTLGVDGLANLMLINPNGIMFGPNAQLDVAGSFTASTAESIVFDDGQAFSAITAEAPPILRLNVTPGLQYGNQPATLVNQGNLRTGQNLSLGAQTLNTAGQLEAGRDIILQGQERRLNEGEYTVGGYLFTQDLSGAGVDLLIPHENVIVATGDVRFEEDYEGPSLYVLAGGQVYQPEGANQITVRVQEDNLIPPEEELLINLIRERLNLDGDIIQEVKRGNIVSYLINDGIGGTQLISITSSGVVTVDIRSGLNWPRIQNLPVVNSNTSQAVVSFNENEQQGSLPSNRSITLGDIQNHGGNIFLSSNQNIRVNSLDSSTLTTTPSPIGALEIKDGGEVTLIARSNVFANSIDSSSSVFGSFNRVIGGDGGRVSILADGQLNVETINSTSGSLFLFDGGVKGNGGSISLVAEGGILVGRLNSSSFAAFSEGDISGGNGGNIVVLSEDEVLLNEIFSFSFSGDDVRGNTGRGGDITISGGRISSDNPTGLGQANLNSVAISEQGLSGEGGSITLISRNFIGNLDVVAMSSSSQSGGVEIIGLNNIEIFDVNIIVSKQLEFFVPSLPSITPITFSTGERGQSGNISVMGNRDIIFNNSSIAASTSGLDSAGDVKMISPTWITLNDTIFNSSTLSDGQAGSLQINAGQGARLAGENSQLLARTSAEGVAGGIEINAPQVIVEQGAQVSTSTSGSGAAGSITINSDVLTLTEGSRILAATAGAGDSGTITINATEAVNLGEGVQNFTPIISVEASDAGQPGNIIINTPQFTLSETAQITATATATATNPAGGGSITINADQMDLAGIVGIFAETEGQAPGGVLTLQPYQGNSNLALTFAPGATISASTSGSGNGGDLRVTAPDTISISGPGRLAVETSGSGRGGNIDISAQRLTLTDGVTLSASTSGVGQAGNIQFNVDDRLTVDRGFVESSTSAESTGVGGNIAISSGQTTLRNGSQAAVTSAGQGQGGNLFLEGNRLTLDASRMVAETASSDGGNIFLTLDNLLLLRNGSFISTTAGTAQAGGDGGNITITVPFIVAIPAENSDIAADAFEGAGGNVNITARGIFGIEPRPQRTPLSDITASSELGVSGVVTLNALDTGFIENSLSNLEDTIVDTTALTAGSCIARTDESLGSFVVTGSGGLPQRPGDSGISTYPTGTVRAAAEPTPSQALQEPDGVYQLPDGRLVLSRECG